MQPKPDITSVIGSLPYRMAFAGGWIDQPFMSRLNPAPPGSMVVVALEPICRLMNRCGMGTSTRRVAAQLWGNRMPEGDPAVLVEALYAEENQGKAEPSGSQDMIGLLYPGVNRLDYTYEHTSGIFPVHIETNTDPEVAAWLESVISMVPVAPRPDGYNPLGIKNLDPAWVKRLGQSGKDCFSAICTMDARALGASMNESMLCWEALLPHTVRHPTLTVDLMTMWDYYRSVYDGAMYSGCGGGYLYVVSKEPVPGGFRVKVRTDKPHHG
ncbi:MAG: hypothetical protein P1S60_07845 [Anaerolineae bacterium]|nr:hypothetical protein [Anaerolineae bacterium]